MSEETSGSRRATAPRTAAKTTMRKRTNRLIKPRQQQLERQMKTKKSITTMRKRKARKRKLKRCQT